MRTRTQNKVTGTSSEAGFHHGQQERSQEELQFFDSATVKVEHTTRGVRFHAKAAAGMPGTVEVSACAEDGAPVTYILYGSEKPETT